jgi:hypothetical protein
MRRIISRGRSPSDVMLRIRTMMLSSHKITDLDILYVINNIMAMLNKFKRKKKYFVFFKMMFFSNVNEVTCSSWVTKKRFILTLL